MSLQFTAVVALPEDQSWVLNTHIKGLTAVFNSSSRGLDADDLLGHQHSSAHNPSRHTYLHI